MQIDGSGVGGSRASGGQIRLTFYNQYDCRLSAKIIMKEKKLL
jgi:hypothetical protein